MVSRSYGPQQLSPIEGDISWDLTPYTVYIAGLPLSATIYVANKSTVDREYALMARLYDAAGEQILEEAIPVFGYTWFPVEAGEYTELKAELQYEQTNAILVVSLRERSTDTDIDNVSTYLVSAVNAGIVIPGVTTTTTTTGFSMDSMMSIMMMIMMFAMMANMLKGEKQKEQIE